MRRDIPLARAAQRSFAAFSGQPAVAAGAAFDAKAFSYYSRADVFLRLSPPPELAPRLLIPDLFIDDAGGAKALDAWLDAMRTFDREADFTSYFETEKKLLAAPVSAFQNSVGQRDYVGKIERYTGLPFKGSYAVLLAPFVKTGSQVNSVVLQDDGSYDIQSVVGPEESGGKLDFLPDEFPGTAWHEIGHGILDTLSDLHQDEINRNAVLEDKLLASRWNCYGGVWEQCVKEHVVRAVMIRLIARDLGEKAAAKRLSEEGEDKFPYLKPMLEALRVYEVSRDAYPTIAEFFPRLLDVFPKPPARTASAAALAPLADGDPGPNWVMQSVRPFSTEGQRARALTYANLIHTPSPDIRLKRAELELLAGKEEAAGTDAAALLASDPDDAGASLIAVTVALKTGDDAQAGRVLLAAQSRCRAAAGSLDEDRASACRSLEGLSRTASNGTPAGPSSAAGPSEPDAQAPLAGARAPKVEFVIDPRVELLSVVAMLAFPSEFEAQFPNGETPYAKDARLTFAAMKKHPAVELVSRLVERRSQPNLPAELLLTPSTEPNPERAEFLDALHDFSKRSNFDAFYARHAADYRTFVATARRESSRQFAPSAASDYLRTPFPENYRFILSPLLSSRFDSNAFSREGGREMDLVHALGDVQRAGRAIRLRILRRGRGPRADPHGDRSARLGVRGRDQRLRRKGAGALRRPLVGLRARAGGLRRHFAHREAAFGGGGLSGAARRQRAARVPAAAGPVRALEGVRDGAARGWFSRLLSAPPGRVSRRAQEIDPRPGGGGGAGDPGREFALGHRSPRRADAGVAGLRRDVRGRAGRKASVVFAADPRLELDALLLALSSNEPAPAGDGYRAVALRAFAPFAAHPAVAEAAEIEKLSGQSGFVAQLLARLSEPPALGVIAPIPGSFVKQAGGRERVLRFLEDARDFSRRSDFIRFFDAHRPEYRLLIDEAREEAARALPPSAAERYLGAPSAASTPSR